MEFLTSFLRSHFARNQQMVSRNIGCFHRLEMGWRPYKFAWNVQKIRGERHGLDDDMEGNWALEIDLYIRQGSVKVNYHCSYHEHVLLRLLSRLAQNGEWCYPGPSLFCFFFFVLTFLCVVPAWDRLTFTQIQHIISCIS